MRRRRKLPPIPKDDGMVVVIAAQGPIHPETAQRICRSTMNHPLKLRWCDDPSYFWAEQVKAKKTMERKHDRT